MLAFLKDSGALALVTLGLAGAIGCESRGPLSPSPVIIPDAITVSVGESQTFTVLNASVLSFTVQSDAGDWRQFVQVAAGPSVNSIRVLAVRPTTTGYIYIKANLGQRRSPLVATMAIH